MKSTLLQAFAMLSFLWAGNIDVVCGQDADAAADGVPIAVKDTTSDAAIRQRIETIFHVVEELNEIEVSVQAGVVILSGEVPESKVREQALALAKRTEGVVMTIERFEERAEVGAQLSPAIGKLTEIGRKLLVKSPLIVLALLTAGVFWWLGGFIYRRKRLFARLKISSLARILIRRLAKLAITIVGLVLALEILDATAIVGAVLGAAGLAGLAFGFAFKNIMENYLSGILLSTRNPFEIGDVIEINGSTGKVALLTARDTVLLTLDGNHLRVPNSVVINSQLLNFSRNPQRRFEFSVGVSVDLDLNEARRLGLEILAKNPAVIADPKPMILIDSLGDSAVILKFFAWMDQREHDFLKTRSESIRMVKVAFDEAGIEMPEPIYRVHLRDAAVSAIPATQTQDDGFSGGTDKIAAPGGVETSSRSSAMLEDVSVVDLSADHSIDEQIAEEQRQSEEENLLAPRDERSKIGGQNSDPPES